MSCADPDKEGFFVRPACGQFYDCNDDNGNIYPGACEIGCDGSERPAAAPAG